jgi:hypothetical protein
MTLSIADDEITSSATTHTATRGPCGWSVTWLGDRTVGYNLAITAMLLADALAVPVPDDAVIRWFAAELELGMTLNEVKRLVAETLPPVPVHDTHAIPAGDEPEPVTGGTVEIEYSIRYSHPIDGVVYTDPMDNRASALSYLEYVSGRKANAILVNRTVTMTAWAPDSGSEPVAAEAKRCPSCPHCGKTFHVEGEDAAAALARLGAAYNEAGTR